MNTPHSKYEHVFAIVRYEEFVVDTLIEDKISVVKVLRNAAAADAEVERLKSLVTSGRLTYFSRITRIYPVETTESLPM